MKLMTTLIAAALSGAQFGADARPMDRTWSTGGPAGRRSAMGSNKAAQRAAMKKRSVAKNRKAHRG